MCIEKCLSQNIFTTEQNMEVSLKESVKKTVDRVF